MSSRNSRNPELRAHQNIQVHGQIEKRTKCHMKLRKRPQKRTFLFSEMKVSFSSFTYIIEDGGGVRTFRPMPFQPLQFQPLQFQPFTLSTVHTFNRSHFQPRAISTACNFNRRKFNCFNYIVINKLQ